MATLKTIAKEAGVSVMTVSNVINGNYSKVSPTTIERVTAIIESSGYRPNMNARSLVGRSSRIIGVIIPYISKERESFFRNPYYSNMIGEIEKILREKNYFLMIRSISTFEEAEIIFKNWNVNGAIFLGILKKDVSFVQQRVNVPTVLIDSSEVEGNHIVHVNVDDYRGGYLATRYLLQNGHYKIAFISPSIESDGIVRKRFEGYVAALKEYGIELDLDLLLTVEVGYEDGIYLAEKIKELGVSAVFTTADIVAIGIIEGLKRIGIKVPNDISIIGFDNLEIGEFITPKLTTIDQSIIQKAHLSVESLLNYIENKNVSYKKDLIIDPSLIIRESVVKKI